MELKQKKEETPKQTIEKPAPKEPTPEPEEKNPVLQPTPEPEPVQNIIKKPPPPKQFIRIQKPLRRPHPDEELYDNAIIEMLRQQFYHQTRQRLYNDIFSY